MHPPPFYKPHQVLAQKQVLSYIKREIDNISYMTLLIEFEVYICIQKAPKFVFELNSLMTISFLVDLDSVFKEHTNLRYNHFLYLII